MGDKNRFNVFGQFIAERIKKEQKIADIAGGKGYLQSALRSYGCSEVCTFDLQLNSARLKKGVTWYCHSLFSIEMAQDWDILVGLHPDQATDAIIAAAAKYHKPFFLMPCCLYPTIFPLEKKFRRMDSFTRWSEHLIDCAKNLGMQVQTTLLPMSGRNLVIHGY